MKRFFIFLVAAALLSAATVHAFIGGGGTSGSVAYASDAGHADNIDNAVGTNVAIVLKAYQIDASILPTAFGYPWNVMGDNDGNLIDSGGLVTINSGSLTAQLFFGNGSNLTGLTASQIAGTFSSNSIVSLNPGQISPPDARRLTNVQASAINAGLLPQVVGNYNILGATATGLVDSGGGAVVNNSTNITITGTNQAGWHVGDGSGLTNLTASQIVPAISTFVPSNLVTNNGKPPLVETNWASLADNNGLGLAISNNEYGHLAGLSFGPLRTTNIGDFHSDNYFGNGSQLNPINATFLLNVVPTANLPTDLIYSTGPLDVVGTQSFLNPIAFQNKIFFGQMAICFSNQATCPDPAGSTLQNFFYASNNDAYWVNQKGTNKFSFGGGAGGTSSNFTALAVGQLTFTNAPVMETNATIPTLVQNCSSSQVSASSIDPASNDGIIILNYTTTSAQVGQSNYFTITLAGTAQSTNSLVVIPCFGTTTNAMGIPQANVNRLFVNSFSNSFQLFTGVTTPAISQTLQEIFQVVRR